MIQRRAEKPGSEKAVHWRRNLFAVAGAGVAVSIGFSASQPFLPLFLSRDLGIHDPHRLALWTGLSNGATFVCVAVSSPIWGWLADRVGRKSMLVRAIAWAGLMTAASGLVTSALELVAVRLLQGLGSGVQAAASALVAAETPREKVPWALGALSSVRAIGSGLGPMLAGLAGTFLPIRAIFVGSGLLLLIASVPVLTEVRETARPERRGRQPGLLSVLRSGGAGTTTAISVLLVAQALLLFAYSAGQQLVVLRLIELDKAHAALDTGITFGILNVAFALAAGGYSRVLPRSGFRLLTIAAGGLLGAGWLAAAWGPTVVILVAASAAGGAAYGALSPALTSMLGLETPAEIRATVFGAGSSAVAAGMAVGPILGGIVAAAAGLEAGFYLGAAAALSMSLVLFFGGREPPEPEAAPAVSG